MGNAGRGTNASAGVEGSTSISGKYVTQVAISSGQITVTYGGSDVNQKISGSTLIFSAVTTATQGSIAWTCENGNILNKYRPQVCRQK